MLIKTKSPLFFDYIRWRTDKEKNFLCTTIGSTGSGKSYANLKAMEILNPDKKPEDIIKNCCFTCIEFLDRLNSGQVQKKDVLVWDEVGIGLSAKDWQSISNKLVNFVLQSFRNLNLVVFFNTPSFSFIDASSRKLFHSLWEVLNINYVTKKCEIKPMLLQTDPRTGKIYFKYLRNNSKEHGIVPIKRLYLSLPSKRLRELYEIKKEAFTTKLNKSIYEDLKEIEDGRGKKKPLTEYQQEIVNLISKGKSIKQIASQFDVSRQAIQDSMGRIRRKGIIVGLNSQKPKKTPEIRGK